MGENANLKFHRSGRKIGLFTWKPRLPPSSDSSRRRLQAALIFDVHLATPRPLRLLLSEPKQVFAARTAKVNKKGDNCGVRGENPNASLRRWTLQPVLTATYESHQDSRRKGPSRKGSVQDIESAIPSTAQEEPEEGEMCVSSRGARRGGAQVVSGVREVLVAAEKD